VREWLRAALRAKRCRYHAAVQRIPVVWLSGPSGVGKSSVGFELFDQLSRDGAAAAYVDLDQVGLCYPPPADDPINHRVKARGLGAVWPGYRAAGVQCLFISGLVDDAEGVRGYADQIPGAALTVIRLRVDPAGLRERFARRGWLVHLTEESVQNAAALDRTDFADLVVDTAGLAVPQVAMRIRDAGLPGPLPPRQVAPLPSSTSAPDPVPVLWVCGPPAVGKSTVGFDLFLRVLADGIPAAYVDLAQIGFCGPAPDDDPEQHRLKANQLGRLWASYRAAGAQCLIVSGNVAGQDTVGRYQEAIPSAAWTVCRLRARPDTLQERILLRGRGGGPGIMGDDLRGRPEAELRPRIAEAVRVGAGLDRAGIGDLCVDTDGREVGDLAEHVRAMAGGWPGRVAGQA
jgi:hypothetical protein